MIVRSFALVGCLLAAPVLAQQPAKQAAAVPEVFFSDEHQKMVSVGVGDAFPEVTLPSAAPGASPEPLASMLGSKATVVAVFPSFGPMAKSLVRDLHYDIRERYSSPDVTTVAIAAGMPADQARSEAQTLKYEGPLLLDADRKLLEQLGTGRMPRVYVLNSKGEVVWLDIEYSLSTRREMKEAVAALAGKPNPK